METGYVIRRNEYHDSVFLMRVAKRLSEQAGILQAAALTGTERNKALLAQMGVSGPQLEAVTPNDLILALKGESRDALQRVLKDPDRWLRPEPDKGEGAEIRSLREALTRQPHSNLAAISVPGQYAAREAREALENGLNVFLFSDNVPVESERALKAFARERNLLVMGPDCGTAIIRGVGIGFSNAVRRGPIGVMGPSGTGIQEFTCLVHRAGSGISHALGTGSRDLSDAIGGISSLSALEALESDPSTRVIAILSKPPGPRTLAALGARLGECSKPLVTCVLGLKEGQVWAPGRATGARTLEDAAVLAVDEAAQRPSPPLDGDPRDLEELARRAWAGMDPGQRYVRGIFAGGTFCYQAQQILREAGMVVHSNVPIENNPLLADPAQSVAHSLVDMGADEFTAGRPHPMIDSRLRCERILAEAKEPEVGVLLLDVILGHNAAPDPAGELAPAIAKARGLAKARGGTLAVVASVCGTEEDPQGLPGQVGRLEDAGAVVFTSSARAARFCARLASGLGEASHVRHIG